LLNGEDDVHDWNGAEGADELAGGDDDRAQPDEGQGKEGHVNLNQDSSSSPWWVKKARPLSHNGKYFTVLKTVHLFGTVVMTRVWWN